MKFTEIWSHPLHSQNHLGVAEIQANIAFIRFSFSLVLLITCNDFCNSMIAYIHLFHWGSINQKKKLKKKPLFSDLKILINQVHTYNNSKSILYPIRHCRTNKRIFFIMYQGPVFLISWIWTFKMLLHYILLRLSVEQGGTKVRWKVLTFKFSCCHGQLAPFLVATCRVWRQW